MKTTYSTHLITPAGRRLLWTIAGWLALGPLSGPCAHAATDSVNAAAIGTNLPVNLTLAKASVDQVVIALHAAVIQHHDDAVDLLRIAVLAKTPKQGHGLLPCVDLKKLLEAAATAAPDQTSKLVDMASSLRPDCADSLQDLLTGASGIDGVGSLGAGQNPGFPGSPGFVGSPPSGAVAFPTTALPSPSPTPVTSVTND